MNPINRQLDEEVFEQYHKHQHISICHHTIRVCIHPILQPYVRTIHRTPICKSLYIRWAYGISVLDLTPNS